MDPKPPRVTVGIATYNRDTYLAAAIASVLAQDYADLECLVVCDGSTNPKIDEVLASFDDPRLRIVRHPRNLGIAAAYNTFISEGRGELIAMLGDDDVCFVDRVRRSVDLFDRDPEIGVVTGDAVMIDAEGKATGGWHTRPYGSSDLVATFFRVHNVLADPSRMVHRRVYQRVGGYDSSYEIAQDFDFWLRAAEHFKFGHVPGGAIVGIRRHGKNASDESQLAREVADVERALEEAIPRYGLRALVPEVDWAVLEPEHAERAALLRLAELFERRALPLPKLAGKLREQAATLAGQRASERPKGRLVIAAFGWNDSGGGTLVPRLAAKELVRRGWEVTVFHAAVTRLDGAGPNAIREWEEDGVRLVGVHNRATPLFEIGHPERDLDEPQIALAFAALLDRVKPDAIHFHNLHNLGGSLLDHAAARGIRTVFSAHNYWLVCPRGYLINGSGAICAGPGERGADCARCVGSADAGGHERRLGELRAGAARNLTALLAPSHAVRRTLLSEGYPAELVDVVHQAMPHDALIWQEAGAKRSPGMVAGELTVGFFGSVYPHKGPQLLVAAAQRTNAAVRVRIHGEVMSDFAEQLAKLDRRGVLAQRGAFSPSELPQLLAGVDVAALPSTWWDCAPLAANECLAARLPLLVPRLGGLAEVVSDGVNGLHFDGLDVDDLARQLDRLASEPGLLERLQQNIAPPRAFSEYVDTLEAYYAGERPGAVSHELTPPAVRWQGDHGLALSLSIINREITKRLDGPVQRVGRDGQPLAGEAPLPHVADVEVRHQWPPDLGPARAGRLAVIQPWEFGAVPREWVESMRRNVDELWVPSAMVRQMYSSSGVDPERIVVIPNGHDPQVFRPDGGHYPLDLDVQVRFLFHSGLIWRKGHDVLLAAWREAFAGRADVGLVVKSVGTDSVYATGEGAELREHAASGALPRVVLIDEQLTDAELASLYRSCDVFVHPYRGEGFAMGVLEAMACGLPAIVTAGGPTDEFCPPEAGWRIHSQRVQFPSDRVDAYDTIGRPWVLEPDRAHLVELLREAAADHGERERRGAAAHAAAASLTWERVAERYRERIAALAEKRPQLAGDQELEPYPLAGDGLQVLATPAWKGADRLGELLREWCSPVIRASGATLVLIADPQVDGLDTELEAHVLAAAAAAGVDLDEAGDINIVMEPSSAERDARLHAAVDAYVVLHAGAPGHLRLAREAGRPVVEPGDGQLAALLRTAVAAAAA
jgi:glycosyltransferase involved in cell wall biosynthesis